MTELKTEHTFYVGGFEERTLDGHTTYASVQKTRVSAGVLHVRKLRKAPATGAETAFEYVHRDHLGSVEKVTDANGAELLVLSHDPFGSRRKSDWTRRLTDPEHGALIDALKLRTSEGFSGHEHLERTGFVHMGGRVYDPELMRFLSPDPVVARPTSSQSWNSYGYAMNSPLSFVDPDGLTFAPVDPGCSVFLSACNPGGQGGGFGRKTQSLPSTLLTIQYGVFISWAPSVGYHGGEIAFGLQPIASSYLFASAVKFGRNVLTQDETPADVPMQGVFAQGVSMEPSDIDETRVRDTPLTVLTDETSGPDGTVVRTIKIRGGYYNATGDPSLGGMFEARVEAMWRGSFETDEGVQYELTTDIWEMSPLFGSWEVLLRMPTLKEEGECGAWACVPRGTGEVLFVPSGLRDVRHPNSTTMSHEFGHVLGFYHFHNGRWNIMSYDPLRAVQADNLELLWKHHRER